MPVIETMSKHAVAGGADLLEGILLSGLIVTFLRVVQHSATRFFDGDHKSVEFLTCSHGINDLWYLLFVPLASLSWSGLFNPNYSGLASMTFHGCLAFAVNYSMGKLDVNSNLNNFCFCEGGYVFCWRLLSLHWTSSGR